MAHIHQTYWKSIWNHFYKHKMGRYALFIVLLFCLVGIFAPFLASSKPIFLIYDGEPYFPLFRYLFYRGFFTKRLDLFFNLLIFTIPLMILFLWSRWRKTAFISILLFQIIAFAYFAYTTPRDPASDPILTQERIIALQKLKSEKKIPTWDFDLRFMNDYARLNILIRNRSLIEQHRRLEKFNALYEEKHNAPIPTLWQIQQDNQAKEIERLKESMNAHPSNSPEYQSAAASLQYIEDKQNWINQQSKKMNFVLMPFLSHFHWEDDAGGQQALNQYVHWWELTRINRKDLLSALIFGVRISLVVGIVSVSLALMIGIPIGAFAGYYGGTFDIIVSRLLEIWEAMPVFFMLLLVVAFVQSKSIFIVIAVIGLFSWTTFSRYVRGEFFKQRNLPYVEASHSLGFRDHYIMFKHILPNAIPPILTLLPFAIMGAITSEAGLSFLGLGEENSCSWGILMDEGRSAFPAESYLLWPPAILLTILLVAIAIVGDNLRDTLDPKLRT